MDDEFEHAIATSLGNPHRDFKKDPLTQEEIHRIVFVYQKEISRKNLHPQLKEIYEQALAHLKKYLILN